MSDYYGYVLKSALLPSVQAAYDDPLKVTKLINVAYFRPITSSPTTETDVFAAPAAAMANVMQYPIMATTVNTTTTISCIDSACSAATVSLFDTTPNAAIRARFDDIPATTPGGTAQPRPAGVEEFLRITKFACLNVLFQNVVQGVLGGDSLATIREYINDVATDVVSNLEYSIPFDPSPQDPLAIPPMECSHVQAGAKRTACQTGSLAFMDACRSRIASLLEKSPKVPMSNTLRSRYFTSSLASVLYLSLEPYLRVKYLATLVPGPWNVRTELMTVSFYDRRYAEVSILRAAHLLATALGLTTVASRYVNLLSARVSQGKEQSKSGHREISQLSKDNRERSQLNFRTSQAFELRRQTLNNLALGISQETRRLESARTVFLTWAIAYGVVVLSGVLLLVTKRRSLFLMMSAVLLTVLLVFVMANLLNRFVAWARS